MTLDSTGEGSLGAGQYSEYKEDEGRIQRLRIFGDAFSTSLL